MRFSLKLFLLICVLASIVIAYFGLRSNIAYMRGSSVDRWHSFAGNSGYQGDGNGGIEFDGNGRALSAEVRSVRQLSMLLDRPEVLDQLTSLQVVGEETYSAFEAERFPRLEEISLAQISARSTSLLGLSEPGSLRRIRIAEYTISMDALSRLQYVQGLDHLHIWTDSRLDVANFPALNQLSLLAITAPSMTDDSRQLLRQKLPSCDIVFHEPER